MVKWINVLLLVLLSQVLFAQHTDVLPGKKETEDKSKKPVQLKEVNISTRKKALTETARGSILDISKAPNAKFWTVADALKQIPGIEIDEASNSITYMGKPVSILRDGIAVAGFENQILNSLNTGSATLYNKIELNLFDLKTEKPTLSFVAPLYENGIFGNASGTIGLNSSLINASVSLSQDKHLTNLMGSSIMMYSPKSELKSEIDYYSIGLKELRLNEQDATRSYSHSVALNDSYFIHSEHSLTSSLKYSWDDANFKSVTVNDQYQSNVLYNRTISSFESSSADQDNYGLKANVSYVYKPKGTPVYDNRIDVSFEFDYKNTGSENSALSNTSIGEFIPGSNYKNIDLGRNKGLFGLIGYEHRHQKWGNFETVLKYFNRSQFNSYDYTYQSDAEGSLNTILQDNDISYNYGALLASWDKKFKAISLRVVLKQDYSNDHISNVKGRESASFITFSPYLSVLRNLQSGSLRFEGQYRKQRPTLSNLSTIIDYGGRYSKSGMQTIGNPDLKPANVLDLSGILNVDVKGVNVIFTGNYVNTRDAISPYRLAVDSILIQTYRNLASANVYKGNVSFNFFLMPRFTAQLASLMQFSDYQIDVDKAQRTLRWDESASFRYTYSPKLQLSIDFNFGGGSSFQSRFPAVFGTNFRTTYIIGKWNFMLMVYDFHQPYRTNEVTIIGDGYNSYSFNKSRRLNASLNLSWRFGKLHRRGSDGKTIIKDDM